MNAERLIVTGLGKLDELTEQDWVDLAAKLQANCLHSKSKMPK